jgi:hypothetical protein
MKLLSAIPHALRLWIGVLVIGTALLTLVTCTTRSTGPPARSIASPASPTVQPGAAAIASPHLTPGHTPTEVPPLISGPTLTPTEHTLIPASEFTATLTMQVSATELRVGDTLTVTWNFINTGQRLSLTAPTCTLSNYRTLEDGTIVRGVGLNTDIKSRVITFLDTGVGPRQTLTGVFVVQVVREATETIQVNCSGSVHNEIGGTSSFPAGVSSHPVMIHFRPADS